MSFGRINRSAVRPAVVAGRFYPQDPEELRAVVQELLGAVPPSNNPAPKALITPHAGFPFSGPIAASAFAQLRPAADEIKRVLLVGPSHFVAFQGLAASSARAFATPLGEASVDTASVREILHLHQVQVFDAAHRNEHSLEVQLPFLQVVLKEFSIVPLVVSDATAEEVAEVLQVLWGGPETAVVISSDLSHYLSPACARQVDRETASAIEAMEGDRLRREHACGRLPICGLLDAARQRGLSCRALDLRNSADTGGPRQQVVGYGAFAFN
jgi:MEMO1 family protein